MEPWQWRALWLPGERADGALSADQTAAVAEEMVCGREPRALDLTSLDPGPRQ